MRISAEMYWLPKAGNSEADYEDSAWVDPVSNHQLTVFRAAVADGATEASFSKVWADLLTSTFGDAGLTAEMLLSGLSDLQSAWLSKATEQPLPWFAEQKLEFGAFATFLGLTVESRGSAEARWSAIAVGDSCLFQIRGPQLEHSFPLKEAKEFDSRPLLISSKAGSNASLENHIKMTEGLALPGDRFFLMSDALACWFLRSWELRTDPLEMLDSISTQDEFASFAKTQRADIVDGLPFLKNDDLTLVHLKIMV